nr:SusC/RagA family TonB-linked outer membrane protein [Pseudopedobacter sp.]
MKKLIRSLFILLLVASTALAQDRTISGTVTAKEDGLPLPGVSVKVKGTKAGTQTGADGRFSLKLPSNSQALVFTYIGFVSQELPISSSDSYNVVLETDAKQLSEVIVTGLGGTRSQKSLSYSAQQVGAEKLALTRETDVNQALAGKVAGVQLLGQAGAKLGASTTIRIRGAGSFSDKQPLYVVDGTPTNIDDLNMDDVESVSVLKGPNATAIYGQRGDAGVVVITTKSAKKTAGIGIEVNQTTTANKVAQLPKYQNTYAGGDSGGEYLTYNYSPNNPVEWKVFDGKKYPDYTDDSSWGPKMDGSEYIPWYAWYPGSQYSFKTAKLTAQPNNIRDFFETGLTVNNNVSFSKVADGFNTRVSFTNLNQKGIIPNSNLNKNYVSTQNSLDLGKYFTATANVNFTSEKLSGDFNDQYSNYSSGNFNSWFHRDLDPSILKELQDLKSPLGSIVSWNHGDPTANTTFNTAGFNKGNYWYNPYTYFNKIDNTSQRDRMFGDLGLTFKPIKSIKISAYIRRNQYNRNYENKTPNILEFSATQTGLKNEYFTGQIFSREDNYELNGSYTKTFKDFSFDFNLGGNIRKNTYRDVRNGTSGGLVVPDLFTISNSKSASSFTNYRQYKKVNSLYGRGSVGYKDFLFVDFSGRNDWSSALPADNNSYFYPSVGASFVFSDIIKSKPNWFSNGKLRASYAQVGSDLDPYQLDLTYGVGSVSYGSNILIGTPNTLTDPNIKPSLSSSYEGGIDLRFLKSRLGISATYYNEVKKNEIISISTSQSSGFDRKIINAGEIQRSGVELQLDGTPVQTKNFTWNASLNVASQKSKVNALAPGLTTYTYDGTVAGDPSASTNAASSSFGFVTIIHQVGSEWGQLRGTGIKKINGQPVLDADGFYTPETNKYFGSVLPDFTGGLFNTFNYKRFNISFLVDFQKGGKFFSLSQQWGTFSGLYAETAANNDKGNNVRDAVSAGGGVHVKGVDASGKPIDTYVEGYDYFHQYYFANRMAEPFVFDASFIKLREISLGFDVPVNKVFKGKAIFQKMSVSLVAKNLWLIAKDKNNKHWDPSELAGRFGENGQLPSTRNIGLNLKFGF